MIEVPPKAVKIRLKAGVGHSTLPTPGHARMVPGVDYTIPYEFYQRIPARQFEQTLDYRGPVNGAAAQDGTDLTANSTTIPTGKKLGKVVQGFGRDAYRLVKLVDAVNAGAGASATWADIKANKVTVDRVGGTSTGAFAGVFNSAVTAGRYGWLQIDGNVAAANVSADVAAGDTLELHPTSDGVLRGGELDEIQVATITGGPAGGTFTLTFGGQTTAGIAFNAAASAVQSALEALSNIAPGDISVSGSAGGPYTVEFIGPQANKSQTLMTASGAGLTGGTTPGVSVARAQAGGLQAGAIVGRALTDASGGKSETDIQWPTTRLRHVAGELYRY